MVNIDLLEGLKVAISKGETLQQAMQSFYNAGYNKKDIEESAKALQYQIQIIFSVQLNLHLSH